MVRDLHAGQLAKEHLTNVLAKEKERNTRSNTTGRIVQKYGEIKGNTARRQIRADDKDVRKVVNIREKREQKP